MFFGTYAHRLNTKNQVAMPSRLRAQAEREGDELVFYAVPEDDRCVYLYTRGELEKVFAALRAKSMEGVADFRRLFSSRVHPVECDSQGRILLDEELKSAAGIERDVVFVGNAERIELWPAEKWGAYRAEREADYTARMKRTMSELFEW
jgi:MraZ protein